MIWNSEQQEWVLRSGRRVYAFTGSFGLRAGRMNSLEYGSDGNHWVDDWTPEERAEVADHMIALWMTWKIS